MQKQTRKAKSGAIPAGGQSNKTEDGRTFYLVERTETIVHRYIVVANNKTEALAAYWNDEVEGRDEQSASYHLGSQEVSGGISVKEGPVK
jgi:hypothetical protein